MARDVERRTGRGVVSVPTARSVALDVILATRESDAYANLLLPVRISRADVADFMLSQLEQDTYLRMAPGVSW